MLFACCWMAESKWPSEEKLNIALRTLLSTNVLPLELPVKRMVWPMPGIRVSVCNLLLRWSWTGQSMATNSSCSVIRNADLHSYCLTSGRAGSVSGPHCHYFNCSPVTVLVSPLNHDNSSRKKDTWNIIGAVKGLSLGELWIRINVMVCGFCSSIRLFLPTSFAYPTYASQDNYRNELLKSPSPHTSKVPPVPEYHRIGRKQ